MTASPATSAFDVDTALHPVAAGRWRAAAPASWSIGTGPNGGFPSELAARAASLTAGAPPRSLTVHLRGPMPPGAHPWMRAAFTTRFAAGGGCEDEGELWSEDGVLLAQSRQLALVRRP